MVAASFSKALFSQAKACGYHVCKGGDLRIAPIGAVRDDRPYGLQNLLIAQANGREKTWLSLGEGLSITLTLKDA